jgi:nucleoid DNA-binding protein
MGKIVARKAKVKLNFMEDKPERYQLKQLTYPPISEKNLVAYIANSSAVPQSTIRACVEAISEAIVYYVINGHRVNLGKFGILGLRGKAGSAMDPEFVSADLVKRITIGYHPSVEIKEMISNLRIETEV